MLLRTLGLILSGAVLAGCAAQPNEFTLPADNPANPSAAEAPLPPESGALGIQQSPTTNTAAEAVYTCPMHPQVRSDKPGKCPICGMKLVSAHSEYHVNHDGHGGQP